MKFCLPLTAVLASTFALHAEEPEKEKTSNITHLEATRLFRQFGPAEFNAGKEIYSQACVVCHGDTERAAINDTVRRFHEAPLQNGSSPHDLFQTLTKGYKNMAAQPWMTPEQKYWVIFYIREAFLKTQNPSQYFKVTPAYEAGFFKTPKGKETIPWRIDATPPIPKPSIPHSEVDQGPVLFGHFSVNANNYVPKGVIIGLDPKAKSVASSQHNAIYDLDTGRLAAFWSGGSIDWEDLNYSGTHSVNASIVGSTVFESPVGMAWASPKPFGPGQHADFVDPRLEGTDGRKYGPLPRDYFQYLGTALNTPKPAIHYKVQNAEVIDMPSLVEMNGVNYFVRTISIAPHAGNLYLRTQAQVEQVSTRVFAAKPIAYTHPSADINDGILQLPATETTVTLHFVATRRDDSKALEKVTAKQLGLSDLTWPTLPTADSAKYLAKSLDQAETLETTYVAGTPDGAFLVDSIKLPQEKDNPWNTRIRVSGLDFLGTDRLAFSSWTGDVFIADHIQGPGDAKVKLTRIASGLHQPLGLKVRDGEIFISCRDQIMRPHDFDGDAKADYYQAFNSDHELTMHFHEFAAGLDTDQEGNFYYVKCSQHFDSAVIPSHGTLIQVSKDGKDSKQIAYGLRSNNGMHVDDDGSVWLTDQEGFWNPQNKIMRVTPGAFHGNMLGWHDSTKISARDEDMVEPMVWLPKQYSNSPSEVFRFPSKGWGPLNGTLGYFEYGKGQLMTLPYEEKNGKLQGAAQALPLKPFSTGIMRGRFHPSDQSFYVGGLFGWGGTQRDWGGIYRVRPLEKPLYTFTGYQASSGKLVLTLTDAIAPGKLSPTDFTLVSYHIERSASYGSKLENERELAVKNVALSADGKTITLDVPSLAPTRILYIQASLSTPEGPVKRELYGSIYDLGNP
jgi:hypothetical protein